MAKQNSKPEAFSTDGFDKLRVEFNTRINDLIYKGLPIFIGILMATFGFFYTMISKENDFIIKQMEKSDEVKNRVVVLETIIKSKAK